MSHIIAFMGLPGAGKTTLINGLCERVVLRVVSRDEIRNSMFVPCTYTDEEKQAAFAAVCHAISVNVRLNQISVIDGMTFSKEGELEKVQEIAENSKAQFSAFYCHCPVSIAKERVRLSNIECSHIALDRTPDLVAKVAKKFRSIPDNVIRLDMLHKPADNIDIIASHCKLKI